MKITIGKLVSMKRQRCFAIHPWKIGLHSLLVVAMYYVKKRDCGIMEWIIMKHGAHSVAEGDTTWQHPTDEWFDDTHTPSVRELFRRNKIQNAWLDIDLSFGDAFYDLDGHPLLRGDPFTRKQYPRLPVLLDNRLSIVGDHIPATSWGSSLANLLTKTCWDAIRRPLIAKNHHVCMSCGTQHDSLDVHEIWSYYLPAHWREIQSSLQPGTVQFGIQKLDDLWPICHACHECFHLGLANVNNRLDVVLSRLKKINLWSPDNMRDYLDTVTERFNFHNEFLWALDFSSVPAVMRHQDGGLTIRSPWDYNPDTPYMLEAESRNKNVGSMSTVLCDVPWRLAREKKTGIWHTGITVAQVLS